MVRATTADTTTPSILVTDILETKALLLVWEDIYIHTDNGHPMHWIPTFHLELIHDRLHALAAGVSRDEKEGALIFIDIICRQLNTQYNVFVFKLHRNPILNTLLNIAGPLMSRIECTWNGFTGHIAYITFNKNIMTIKSSHGESNMDYSRGPKLEYHINTQNLASQDIKQIKTFIYKCMTLSEVLKNH